MRSRTRPVLMCFGSGSWTRMPWILGSALSRSTSASRSASVMSAGRSIVSWYRPASSHAFPFMRTYVADAGCSPTSPAASPGVTPWALRAAISAASSVSIAWPMAFPSMSFALACKVHRPCLPDDDDLDLPRILQLPLDLAGDLLGQPRGLGVVHRPRGDDDAHFPPRLNRVHLLDAREFRGDLLDRRQPLDVGLEGLAARSGPRARDGIGRLDDDADRGVVGHVVVMRRDAVDDHRMLAVLRRDLHAQLHVRAVVLVCEHLADVVQQSAPFRERDIELELGRHDARHPRHFLRVLQDVLPVGGPVAHPAH